nr:MAG TPA: hypothetical protein [Caudoviricetes sp.]
MSGETMCFPFNDTKIRIIVIRCIFCYVTLTLN